MSSRLIITATNVAEAADAEQRRPCLNPKSILYPEWRGDALVVRTVQATRKRRELDRAIVILNPGD